MNRIIIIGSGPVGLALSIALARYKVKSVVIEKRTEPTSLFESRAIIWMPKGIEFLEWIGLLDEFKKNSIIRKYHRFRIKGRKLMDLDFSFADSKYGYSLNMPQYYSEYLFEQEALRLSDFVTVVRNQELISINESNNSVIARTKNTKTNLETDYIGNYLIGCDGTKSILRELLHIELLWKDYGNIYRSC